MRREAPHRSARLPGLRPGEDSRVFPLRRRTFLLPATVLVAIAALAGPAAAQTLMTQEEALALAFPGDTVVERRTAYLSPAQLDRARELAGAAVDIEQTIVTYYVGRRNGTFAGAAYFDVHRVRTKNEVVMVVVDPDHTLRRMEVLKFTEPPEYRAPDAWIQQLEGRPLDDALSVRGGIRSIAGATLTARAMTEAARRVLALHAVIEPFGGTP
ncbi:MAG: FMN-binding protein [Longimicrobiales bacterium]|nr:FMN-binding protein [Longimicrobiales bacterium]